ncbi:MAG: exodeoxyribonuclease VII large subunit [Acidobacteriota bacterium]|nr:exodeoxyribonuclease VII large subunit [Acidobacteriota bacterium]
MSQAIFNFESARRIYTVSALTQEIRSLLEPKFLDVWISGEVSNFRPAASGHLYFTLKDESAQLRVVCFRNQARYLKFRPQDGISLIARGRLSVYEPRGEYQLVAEFLEPAGLGALQLAFEQLKRKLAAEGLFAPERKKPLPLLPRTVGVVTSPTGAVIRDILRVLHRRFSNMNVLLYPAQVQGEAAAAEIAQGIRYFSQERLADVVIIARGGGSIEDLWAFNEEVVARAIAASAIPIISAVGHETDFTIADFVADLRAPTPSAAAELVVHRKQDFETEIQSRQTRMAEIMRLRISEMRQQQMALALHPVFQTFPVRLAQKAQRLDDLAAAIDRVISSRLSALRERASAGAAAVARLNLPRLLDLKRTHYAREESGLAAAIARTLEARRTGLAHLHAVLQERNPQAILRRGYAVVRDEAGKVIRSAADVMEGNGISVELAHGGLEAEVRSRKL